MISDFVLQKIYFLAFFSTFVFFIVCCGALLVGMVRFLGWLGRRVMISILEQICFGPLIPFVCDPIYNLVTFIYYYRLSTRWPEVEDCFLCLFNCLMPKYQNRFVAKVLKTFIYSVFIIVWWGSRVYILFLWFIRLKNCFVNWYKRRQAAAAEFKDDED